MQGCPSVKLELYPGRFYESKCGQLWCCYGLVLFREAHSQAQCIHVASGRIETFFCDGRYDAAGKREHTLVREVVASHAVVPK